MSAKITSRQKQQAQKLVGDALTALNPTKDGAQRVLGTKEFQNRFKQLFIELSGEYYRLLSDDEAEAWIVKYAKQPKKEARHFVIDLRQKALWHGVPYTENIHAEVQPGCRFKRDISQMGPTREDFKYLQDWNFPDPATEHALVSWVPVPLAESTKKNASEQTAVVAAFKTHTGLPAWYELSFGSVNHVAGLALAHFKATGKNPFVNLSVRTDTYDAGGTRLELYWDQDCLGCGHLVSDDDHVMSELAVFPVGVIKALGR